MVIDVDITFEIRDGENNIVKVIDTFIIKNAITMTARRAPGARHKTVKPLAWRATNKSPGFKSLKYISSNHCAVVGFERTEVTIMVFPTVFLFAHKNFSA
jgi:hypothetical protein